MNYLAASRLKGVALATMFFGLCWMWLGRSPYSELATRNDGRLATRGGDSQESLQSLPPTKPAECPPCASKQTGSDPSSSAACAVRLPALEIPKGLATYVRGALTKADQKYEKIMPFGEDGLPEVLPTLERQFDPSAASVNTYETAYWLMLQLRKTMELGNQLGHIGFFPIQAFKFFWNARMLSIDLGGDMTTCEVGFGTGHSTALVLTATASSKSLKSGGGRHYIFTNAWLPEPHDYLKSIFGERMQFVLGGSEETIPKFARENPGIKCDFISIDGSHAHPTVLHDIQNMHLLATERTLLMMDDVQSWGVRHDIATAIHEGAIGVAQVFSAERYSLDWTFSSTMAQLFWHGDFNRGKLFLEGFFLFEKDGKLRNSVYEPRMGPSPPFWYSMFSGWLADTFRWKQ